MRSKYIFALAALAMILATIVVLTVLTNEAEGAGIEAPAHFTLDIYEPPTFQIGIWLDNNQFAGTIAFTEDAYLLKLDYSLIDEELTDKELTNIADAFLFATELQKALP